MLWLSEEYGLFAHCSLDRFWTNEFKLFYDPNTGLDIDGAWIDMNEPSSVCIGL